MSRRVTPSRTPFVIPTLLLVLALVSVGCARTSDPQAASPPTSGANEEVQNLTDVGQLQDAFNADEGSPRLVLILSPT